MIGMAHHMFNYVYFFSPSQWSHSSVESFFLTAILQNKRRMKEATPTRLSLLPPQKRKCYRVAPKTIVAGVLTEQSFIVDISENQDRSQFHSVGNLWFRNWNQNNKWKTRKEKGQNGNPEWRVIRCIQNQGKEQKRFRTNWPKSKRKFIPQVFVFKAETTVSLSLSVYQSFGEN